VDVKPFHGGINGHGRRKADGLIDGKEIRRERGESRETGGASKEGEEEANREAAVTGGRKIPAVGISPLHGETADVESAHLFADLENLFSEGYFWKSGSESGGI